MILIRNSFLLRTHPHHTVHPVDVAMMSLAVKNVTSAPSYRTVATYQIFLHANQARQHAIIVSLLAARKIAYVSNTVQVLIYQLVLSRGEIA